MDAVCRFGGGPLGAGPACALRDGWLDHLLDAVPDPVLALDVCGRVVHANAAAHTVFGAGLPSRRFVGFLAPVSAHRFEHEAWAHLTAGGQRWSGEVNVVTPDDGTVPARLVAVARHVDGTFAGAAVTVSDRRAVVALEDRLREATMHDPVTQLPNRHRLEHDVARALARSRRDGLDHTLMLVELDGLEIVAGNVGHAAADALLVAAAGRVREIVRAEDVVARTGDDELAVLLASADPQAVRVVAARVLEALRAPFVVAGVEVAIDAALGLAITNPGCSGFDELAAFADAALHRARACRAGYELAM